MTLTPLYVLIGVLIAGIAFRIAQDRGDPKRRSKAAFWGLIAAIFLVGEQLPAWGVGVLVVAISLIAAAGGVERRGAVADPSVAVARERILARLGLKLFLPALAIPALTLVALLVTRMAGERHWFALDAQQQTLYSLAFGCVAALVVALRMLRQPPVESLGAAGGIADAIAWPLILPLWLAMLGNVFAACHVGDAVAAALTPLIDTDSRFACVLAYALGMVVFTVVMGNAFAAFPVMTAGVGLPLLVRLHHADPAALGALGMLSGYCGTLLTPMAANFNVVPAVLLELRDPHGVIRAQAPTGLALLAFNILLMNLVLFR